MVCSCMFICMFWYFKIMKIWTLTLKHTVYISLKSKFKQKISCLVFCDKKKKTCKICKKKIKYIFDVYLFYFFYILI